MEISNKEILHDPTHSVILNRGLNPFFNDTVFRNQLNCRNDNLEIVDYKAGTPLVFYYANIPLELA